jgi:N-acetylneuraminic acid mutarotase
MCRDAIRLVLNKYSRPLVCAATLLAIALAFVMTNVVAGGKPVRSLGLDDRVSYQRAIEEIYWRHRIWPAENSGPKPAFDDAMPQAVMREKAEDYLRKSAALDLYWQRPITGEQLQAEVNRMAAQTKQPEILRELWAALHNEPYVIAECLARPVLVERLLRNWYAYDERFHGGLRARAEAELRQIQTPARMRALGGQYHEQEWVRGSAVDKKDALPAASITLTPYEWETRLQELARAFAVMDEKSSPATGQPGTAAVLSAGPGGGIPLEDLPIGRFSRLAEGEDRFYVLAITSRGTDRLKVASVEWRKEQFESWWNQTQAEWQTALATPAYEYHLSQLALNVSSDSWTATVSSAPSGRINHTAIWTGNEMIVWGGQDSTCCSNIYQNTGGRYNPATDTWVSTSTLGAPTPRSFHTAVWTGSEMIVWGGQDAANRFNTGGRYNPLTNTWTGVNTAGAPVARTSHTAVWTGSEMIVWGGQDSSSCCGGTNHNTGGRYNPASDSWVATSVPNAPSPRNSHTAIWTGSEMIIWGGQDNSNRFNTGGRYNPSTNTWTGVNTAGAPVGRALHTAVWTGSVMIVWGGGGSGCCGGFNTGGKYDPVTDAWMPTNTISAPEGRSGHTAVWTGSVMIIWGGFTNSSSGNTGGRYTPETDSWTATNLTGAPSGRDRHTAVWTGSEMIVWSGNTNGTFNSGGRYNPANNSWTPTSITVAPSGRERHTAVWTGSEMIVWGGYGPTTNFGSTFNSPLNTGNRYFPATDSWTPVETAGAPTARHNHTAIWTGSEMIVWAGYDGTNVLATGARYRPALNTWVAMNLVNSPDPRFLHTAVWNGSVMIIWGGTDGFNYSNRGGRYNPTDNNWMSTSTTDAPNARGSHTAVWAGNEMIVWGGFNSALGYLNTGGRYNPLTNGWTAINTSGAPAARINHTAIWNGSEMVVWGGTDGSNHLNTGGRYSVSGNSWMPVATTDAPSGRSLHTAVWTGSEMIVWGGSDSANYFDTGGRYNTSANGWTATTTLNAPTARHRHTAVWTGSEMIVWGGFDGANYPITGGRYSTGTTNQCSFTLSNTILSFPASAAVSSVNVSVTNGCSWSAITDDQWITILTGAGSGDGVINFSVAQNPSANPRTGTIIVGTQEFIVAQGAAFADVPTGHPFYNQIGKLSARGVTGGCGGGNYCPDAPVTREQMAAFIIRAMGEFNPPFPAMQRFGDVPPTNVFYAFIEQMAVRQITSGCGGGNYCPSASVTREQMAAFIIRGIGEFNPPVPAMQRFGDVPPSNPFYNFIDRMAALGITSGCSAMPPLYCPTAPVTRGQMAVFLVTAFNL